MWLVALLVGAIVALVAKWVIDRLYRQQTIQRMGLPGPKPGLLLGNMADLQGYMKQNKRPLMELKKKYGNTFGYYEGEVPVIVTSDLEIVKHVLIKSFSSFHSRKKNPLAPADNTIVAAQGEQWKRLRMILSPSFSARCMKEMSPLVNNCVGHLLDVFEKRVKEDKPFNIMEDFQGLTMSAIAACGFGLEVDSIDNQSNIFLKKCRAVFTFVSSSRFLRNVIVPIMFISPRFLKFLKFLRPDTFSIPRQWFFDTAARIIEERKAQKGKPRRDFIQLMLEAEEKEAPAELTQLEVAVDDDTEEAASHTPVHRRTTHEGKGMTLSEMQAQCMVFLLAGYETTSTALSFAAYELVMNPDIQKRLQEEIDKHLQKDQLPDYMTVQKMPYLDRVFSEVLRLHTIGQLVENRESFEDITVGDLHIPRRVVVQVHVEAIHKDPTHWGPEDPNLFVPDRFLPERKAARNSLAWLPFGGGPRNCIGMRFALMEAKITLARMLKAYTIVRTAEQKVPLPETNSAVFKPEHGVIVRLKKKKVPTATLR